MYTNKDNILQLIALLKAHGICQIVLCPGSRNSPIVHSLALDTDFQCHLVVDERSAGFYALGIIQQTKTPVAVCCTSGSAVLNLSPAVAEAFYQELPLLVITADRPQAWIGQMDGQTLPQQNAYGPLVKKTVNLPEINTPESSWHCNRLINEAILELEHHTQGPVHINIPLSEPLFDYTVNTLPKVRKINRNTHHRAPSIDQAKHFNNYKKRLIIVGQMPPCPQLKKTLRQLGNIHNCAILAEHPANMHCPDFIGNFDTILATLPSEQSDKFKPDLIVSLGGHIVSKRLKNFLRTNPAKAHWHISPSGQIIDIYQQVTDIIEEQPLNFLKQLCQNPALETNYKNIWRNINCEVKLETLPFSDALSVGELITSLPENSSLHLANSSSVRLAQLYNIETENIEVLSNRGTNGIEGSLSSAVGYSSVTTNLNILIIGDLSFFYDMNGIWNRQLKPNLRIMLNNNGGGGIFHQLPGLNKSHALDYITATHNTHARAWAETTGFIYMSACNKHELKANMPLFLKQASDKPILFEIFTSMDTNSHAIRQYHQQLKHNHV